jgi:hypothetical protein
MSKRERRERLPPFVPLLKSTLGSPAWRAMSHGARSVYVALKAFYNQNNHNNGKLFLSMRDAAETIGSGTEEIVRWYRELQHYGFIVQVSGGCLGVEGEGFAPHWRLTELGYMKDPPTLDFMRWDGVKFKGRRRIGRDSKQNPVPERRHRVIRNGGTPPIRKGGTPNSQSVPERRHIVSSVRDTERRYILSLPLVRPTAPVSWPPPVMQEVLNIVEEQLHDLDPLRVRARKRAELARLQSTPTHLMRRNEQRPLPASLEHSTG